MKEKMSDPCRRRRPPPPAVDPLVALSNLAAIRSQMDSLHRFLSTSVAANTILPKSTLESVSSQISDALHHVILNSALLISLSSSRSDTHMHIIEIEKTQMAIGKILEEEKHTENNLSLVCNNRGKNKTTYISFSPDSILIETADSGEQLNTSPFSSVDTQMPIHKISKEVETAGNGPSVCNRGKAECASPSPDLVLAGASGSGEQANGSNLSSTETQMSICEIKKRAEQVVVEEDAEEEERERDGEDGDVEVVELDAVELLAEHLHFCEICGKGFRRDANLRMHMRAHGDRFKSPGALAKPENSEKTMNMSTAVRFSCPYAGCNRSRKHKKFRALKSVMCVKNHFKRSHCPKMYACDRCNKESFSVLADLKSHLRHCGEARWRCSCGTSFSRKDKLFGNMALFEGHMPAVGEDECAQGTGKAAVDDATMVEATRDEENVFDDGFLERLGSIEDKFLQELLGTSSDSSIGIDGFFNF